MWPSPEVLAKLLLLLPLAAAVVVWLPGAAASRAHGASQQAARRRADRLQNLLTIGTSGGSLLLALAIAQGGSGPLRFAVGPIALYLDSLSILFLLLVSLVAFVASCYVGPCWRRREGTGSVSSTLFHSLFNLFHFTMVLVPMVSNLVVLWIGIELTTVTSTVLVAAERRREHFEAAWKYIIITSTGIIFALLGTLFLTTGIDFVKYPNLEMNWPDLVGVAGDLNPNVSRLAFLFVLIGYGAKAGLAPMHTWLPDAHGEAPYPVSALLSGVLLKSALYVILRFLTITNAALGDDGRFTSRTLLCVGLLSLVTAIPFILKRNPLKRVLAYHSLEHMGIITVGIGIGGPIALFGALLHVLNHGITKSLMFLAYGNVQDNFASDRPGTDRAVPPDTDERRSIHARSLPPPRGVLRAMPWTGSMLALGGLALVGSPPFSIFLSEFLILWGAVANVVDQPSIWLMVAIPIFLVSITLIFGGLVRHLSRVLLGKPPDKVRRERVGQVLPLLGLLALVVLLGVVIPSSGVLDLRRLLDDSVTIVCGGRCAP